MSLLVVSPIGPSQGCGDLRRECRSSQEAAHPTRGSEGCDLIGHYVDICPPPGLTLNYLAGRTGSTLIRALPHTSKYHTSLNALFYTD